MLAQSDEDAQATSKAAANAMNEASEILAGSSCISLKMATIFESRDADAANMRDLSVERVCFALRRLTAFVPRAKVQFSDVNGPRGGVDKRCQVELSTVTTGTVVIATLARDLRTALDRSLGRATRVLTRSLQRHQKPVRSRTAKLALDS
jgi:hypothetical protein